jgi:hypothetical protein
VILGCQPKRYPRFAASGLLNEAASRRWGIKLLFMGLIVLPPDLKILPAHETLQHFIHALAIRGCQSEQA